MDRLPLEDNAEDILGKAMRGLGLDIESLARRAGVSTANVRAALDGFAEPNILEQLARALGLDAAALIRIARGEWHPGVDWPDGVQAVTSSFGPMRVNAHLIVCPDSVQAVLFDTGTDHAAIRRVLDARGLRLAGVFLTHAHTDHVAVLERVVHDSGLPARIARAECFPAARAFDWGDSFRLGGLTIETRECVGHSPGGTTYVVHTGAGTVAVVGDAVFAGSIGGPKVSYRRALETNEASIFTLPAETVLLPGHGPPTTVALERRNNPFHARH